jgi:hypothetical protein
LSDDDGESFLLFSLDATANASCVRSFVPPLAVLTGNDARERDLSPVGASSRAPESLVSVPRAPVGEPNVRSIIPSCPKCAEAGGLRTRRALSHTENCPIGSRQDASFSTSHSIRA